MKSMKRKKGFTLAELLIVVAIIGVLVAISIPIFTSQLKKARKAKNWANMRAAYASAASDYLTNGGQDGLYFYRIDTGICEKLEDENFLTDYPPYTTQEGEDFLEETDIGHFYVSLKTQPDGDIAVVMLPGYLGNQLEFVWTNPGTGEETLGRLPGPNVS